MNIPPIPVGLADPVLVAAINDRLRRIEQAIAEVKALITVAINEMVFPVAGVLAVNSSAAPLLSIPSSGTPTAIVALVKTAPTGSGLTFQVVANGATVIGAGTIAAGTTSITVTTSLQNIAANAVLTLAITAVGATVAGADLTVMVRF